MSAESAKNTKKSKKTAKVWGTVLVLAVSVAVVGLVAVILARLFRTEETRSVVSSEVISTEAMVCEAKNPKDPFFAPEGAIDPDHEIKVTFKNDKADKMSYEYDADFASAEEVEAAEAKTHADFNLYIGKDVEKLSAQFMPIDNELKINIYTDADNLNSNAARIFFISAEDFAALEEYNIDNLKRVIQTAGFHCEIDDD